MKVMVFKTEVETGAFTDEHLGYVNQCEQFASRMLNIFPEVGIITQVHDVVARIRDDASPEVAEELDWAMDELLEWVNERIVDGAASFGWEDGAIFLTPLETE